MLITLCKSEHGRPRRGQGRAPVKSLQGKVYMGGHFSLQMGAVAEAAACTHVETSSQLQRKAELTGSIVHVHGMGVFRNH